MICYVAHWQMCQTLILKLRITAVHVLIWMGLVLWDMRSCPSALVLSISLHHTGLGNVAPVCQTPEFSVRRQRAELVFRKIRWPWSDIKVLMSNVALRCDLVTAYSGGTLKCYIALKVRFSTLCYTPLVFRRHFQPLWTDCSELAASLPCLNEIFLQFLSNILQQFA